MKEKAKLSRMEAVHRLENLARQIEHGTIRMGDKSFAVPDDVRVAIRARRDELEIDLKWQPNGARTEPRDEAPQEDEEPSEETPTHTH
jgi:amphi-Trp domain-containing protein